MDNFFRMPSERSDYWIPFAILSTAYSAKHRVCSITFGVKKTSDHGLSANERKLTLLATDLLTVIIKGNIENASKYLLHLLYFWYISEMFTECFTSKQLLAVITGVDGEWRSSALQLLKQLLLLAITDQYMAGVVQVINSNSPQQQLELNNDLLKVKTYKFETCFSDGSWSTKRVS